MKTLMRAMRLTSDEMVTLVTFAIGLAFVATPVLFLACGSILIGMEIQDWKDNRI